MNMVEVYIPEEKKSDSEYMKVYSVLQTLQKGMREKRIRLFLGSTDTGADWLEVYDTMGYVGKSTGSKPCFLLINNKSSIGGGAISLDSVVKITAEKQTLYQHPKYSVPKLEVKECSVLKEDGEIVMVASSERKAIAMKEFLQGNRNSYRVSGKNKEDA